MKIGVSGRANGWLGLPLLAKWGESAGLDGVEAEMPLQAGYVFTNLALPVLSVHAPSIPSIRGLNLSAIWAKKWGATVVTCHPGIRPLYFRLTSLLWKKLGVTLTIENTPPLQLSQIVAAGAKPNFIFPESEVWKRYTGAATLDTGHGARLGLDLPSVVRELGPRLREVHLNDCVGQTDHRPLGEGKINFNPLFQTLIKMQFQGLLILEFSIQGPEHLAKQAILIRELLQTT